MLQGVTRFLYGMAFGLALLVAQPAKAVPTLQLDIIGGTYDAATQMIVTNSSTFTLLALATAGSRSEADILADTFFVSMALAPAMDEGPFNAGTFSVNGNTVQATDTGLVYGTPPTEDANPDLGSHGHYPTYFHEVAFQFDANDTTTTYNSENDTGGVAFDENGYGTFFYKLEMNVGGLVGKTLHFDLYDTALKNNGTNSIDSFAPFSHDAEYIPGLTCTDCGEDPVPAPASTPIFLLAVALIALMRRHALRKAQAAATPVASAT